MVYGWGGLWALLCFALASEWRRATTVKRVEGKLFTGARACARRPSLALMCPPTLVCVCVCVLRKAPN